MQHVHVKRKEKTMNHYMIEEFHKDPILLRRRLTTEAHRQRAQAIGEAIAWLFGGAGRALGHLKARLTARPVRWIERLG
jgi:hypothetical protein